DPFEAASAPSPDHGWVDQGDCERSNHDHVDDEPEPPAGIAVHRFAPAYRANVNAAGGVPIHAASDRRRFGERVGSAGVFSPLPPPSSIPIAANAARLGARSNHRALSSDRSERAATSATR